tara:strand:+ start:800 stop:994 length:195 start_codon:yes stop_codon:yes gene_type:complete
MRIYKIEYEGNIFWTAIKPNSEEKLILVEEMSANDAKHLMMEMRDILSDEQWNDSHRDNDEGAC